MVPCIGYFHCAMTGTVTPGCDTERRDGPWGLGWLGSRRPCDDSSAQLTPQNDDAEAVELERRETLLIILGAGASFDCLPGRFDAHMDVRVSGLPTRHLNDVFPPVTQRLAASSPLTNWVLNYWRWAREVVDCTDDEASWTRPPTRRGPLRSRQRFAVQTRKALRACRSEHGTDLATRFYLRDLLWACTSYVHSDDLTGGTTNQLARSGTRWIGAGVVIDASCSSPSTTT